MDLEMRISEPQEYWDKFRQVFLYVLQKIGDKENFGETELCTLLYFLDMDHYEIYEEQLMGLRYTKQLSGPVPNSVEKVIAELLEAGKISKHDGMFEGNPQTRYALPGQGGEGGNGGTDLALDLLSESELAHIDTTLDRLINLTNQELTELTLKDVPLLAPEHGETVDYESALYRTPDTAVREYPDDDD